MYKIRPQLHSISYDKRLQEGIEIPTTFPVQINGEDVILKNGRQLVKGNNGLTTLIGSSGMGKTNMCSEILRVCNEKGNTKFPLFIDMSKLDSVEACLEAIRSVQKRYI